MAKMKYWNGTTWEILDAKDADTLDGKDYSDIKNEIEIKYAVASGTNSYTVSIPGITTLVEGLSVKIKFTNANTGASTLNINGLGAKEIRKSNGNALSGGNIKAGQICHLVYTGSVFQLLGEGGEYGTAQPEHVLQGYTIGTEQGIVAGTMPNQGQKIITPSTVNIAIPRGYHDGTGYVVGDSDLIPSNIKKGVNIFGVLGTLKGINTELYSDGVIGVAQSLKKAKIPSGEYEGIVEFTDSYIKLGSLNYDYYAGIEFFHPMDFTGKSTLYIEWAVSGDIYNIEAKVHISPNPDRDFHDNTYIEELFKRFGWSTSKQIDTLDVYNINGSYYLRILMRRDTSTSNWGYVQIYRIWLV